jgi:hypothetical protein
MCKGLQTLDQVDRQGRAKRPASDPTLHFLEPQIVTGLADTPHSKSEEMSPNPWGIYSNQGTLSYCPNNVSSHIFNGLRPNPVQPAENVQVQKDHLSPDPALVQMQVALTDLVETVKKQSKNEDYHNELKGLKQHLQRLEKTQAITLAKHSKLIAKQEEVSPTHKSHSPVQRLTESQHGTPRPDTRAALIAFEQEVNKLKSEESDKTRALRELRDLLSQETQRGDLATKMVEQLEGKQSQWIIAKEKEEEHRHRLERELYQLRTEISKRADHEQRMATKYIKERGTYRTKLCEVHYFSFVATFTKTWASL